MSISFYLKIIYMIINKTAIEFLIKSVKYNSPPMLIHIIKASGMFFILFRKNLINR